jgi:hypothetical protein
MEDSNCIGKAADVGIGISGEEGLQAVNSSDYAISQVRLTFTYILVSLFELINCVHSSGF